ncbi:hypothetical protein ABIC84_004164 [Mucilaginibacter sp. 3215]
MKGKWLLKIPVPDFYPDTSCPVIDLRKILLTICQEIDEVGKDKCRTGKTADLIPNAIYLLDRSSWA